MRSIIPFFSAFSQIRASSAGIFEWIRDVFSLPEDPYPSAFADYASAYRTEIPDFPLLSVWVGYAYTEAFAADLRRFKYRAERAALERFDEGLIRLAAICRSEVGEGAFVAYPPSPLSRTLLRGYDHTALLAERFAKHSGLPVVRLLKTPFVRSRQAGGDRSERMSNVSNKFFLPSWAGAYSGRPVVFFDDVVSSASTALECAKVFRENGNYEIHGFFLASSTAMAQEGNVDKTFRP